MHDTESTHDTIIHEAMEFLRLVGDADGLNRSEALGDIKFSAGEQWPVEVQNSRNLESRPCITINKIDAFVRQICNQQRQQRPRIKVHPVNDQADLKVSQIIEGLVRHIEVNSNADTAYDMAFEYAVRMGWGYWRIITDYTREDSFDQEIYIEPVDNPFSVYFDPNSVAPDGSDAERCLITTVIPKSKFRDLYPGKDDGTGFTSRGTGDSSASWVMRDDIRIAEYFHVEREAATLCLMEDGTSVFESDLPDEAIPFVIDRRKSARRVVKWCKLTAMDVLEEKIWPGRWIPIVPVYGAQITVEDQRRKYGIVRFAKDPQRMYNFWRTAMTEAVALAPKAKWLLAEGQDEGHEQEWSLANIKSYPVLRYKQTDIDGRPAQVPTRIQPEAPPQGIMESAAAIANDLQSVVGIYDPAQQLPGNMSGKALQGQQMQTDQTNFHFYDNLTRSIKHTGKIVLDLIPKIYDTQRAMRIIGADGTPEMTTINGIDELGRVLNDVTVGEYDVVMDTGPGYLSKRQAAVDAMIPMVSAYPKLFEVAGDLLFKNMDFPGADVIADRLASMNPLSQIDQKSDIPPQAQMAIKQGQQQVQQLQQQLQAAQLEINNRAQVAQIHEEGSTKRKLMDVTARAHNTETMAEVKVNDQNTRAITSQNKTELEAIVAMLLKHMDTGRLEREIANRNVEQQLAMQRAQADIAIRPNPLTQPSAPTMGDAAQMLPPQAMSQEMPMEPQMGNTQWPQ